MRVRLESQGSWPLCESTLSENGYEEKGKNMPDSTSDGSGEEGDVIKTRLTSPVHRPESRLASEEATCRLHVVTITG